MITLSSVQILLLTKKALFCFWFSLTFYVYSYLLPENSLIKDHVKNLNYVELFGLVFIFVISFKCLILIFESCLSSLIVIDHNYIIHSFTGEENSASTNSGQNTSHNSNTTTADSGVNPIELAKKAGDSAIMVSSLSAAAKLAQKVPSTTGKIAVAASGVALGAAGIVVNNAVSNLDVILTTKNFLFWLAANNENSSNFLESLFNLTGNNAIDLLLMIQWYQNFELILIPFIVYNLLLFYINEEKMESILLKVLPVFIVNTYMKSLKVFKKQGIFILLALLALTYTCNYLAFYYLDYFISNLDKIVEICLKDLNN